MSSNNLLKRLWFFIWKSNSIWSWLICIILAFIIVKFLVYPFFGLLLGTTHPVVAVVSSSMDHNGNFNEWWSSQGNWYEKKDITKEQFEKFSFKNGFNKGDIMVLKKADNLKVGDVIVFLREDNYPIIHRLIYKDGYYQTKGDANPDSFSALGEINIPKEKIIGKAAFKIPFFGWIKIIFVDIIVKPYCVITNNLWPCGGV